jgi:hypothetical protein
MYEKRIVRQVGYLQELNRDARSTKHKKGTRSVFSFLNKLLSWNITMGDDFFILHGLKT